MLLLFYLHYKSLIKGFQRFFLNLLLNILHCHLSYFYYFILKIEQSIIINFGSVSRHTFQFISNFLIGQAQCLKFSFSRFHYFCLTLKDLVKECLLGKKYSWVISLKTSCQNALVCMRVCIKHEITEHHNVHIWAWLELLAISIYKFHHWNSENVSCSVLSGWIDGWIDK